MMQALRALRDAQLAGVCLAPITFFEPKKAFFDALGQWREKRFIEAGAGMGHVARAAEARGFNMLAVDLCERDGQWEKVVRRAAESMPYGPGVWLLMCRPDHSGWAYDTLEIALQAGASVFYAGLERNFDVDLGDYLGRESHRWDEVGEDGESLLMFEPAALLSRE